MRLELKGKKFEVFESSSGEDIDEFFNVLLKLESSISREHTTKKSIEDFSTLQLFMEQHCVFRKYSLTIRKCGKEACSFCSPVQMSRDIIDSIEVGTIATDLLHAICNYCFKSLLCMWSFSLYVQSIRVSFLL